MEKYTQRQLKGLKNFKGVTDISNLNEKELKELIAKEDYLNQIGFSSGIYGINGALFQGHKTLDFYVIIGRTNSLFYLA